MAEKTETLTFLGMVLEPIVRLMLRAGVTWKEFSEYSKVKFVDVASADFGIRGRPTNASRVAILTGLDRRDVRKLRDAAADPRPAQGYQSKGSQILGAWHQDADFLDLQGNPAALAVDGDSGTFAALMRRYAPALPVVAMIKELKSAAAIEELADGRLRPLTRVYVPRSFSSERLRLWASVLSDLAHTIEHNFTRDGATPSRFERRALNLKVDRRALPEFRELLEREGQAFLERIDDWLAAHRADAGNDAIRLGVGVFQIQDRTVARKPTRRVTP
jgi:hypothetical protein